jgi:hypothetical protein
MPAATAISHSVVTPQGDGRSIEVVSGVLPAESPLVFESELAEVTQVLEAHALHQHQPQVAPDLLIREVVEPTIQGRTLSLFFSEGFAGQAFEVRLLGK